MSTTHVPTTAHSTTAHTIERQPVWKHGVAAAVPLEDSTGASIPIAAAIVVPTLARRLAQ